jgi:hypothetical protein
MSATRSHAASWTRIPLAGGGEETLLSEVGAQYLLHYFTTAEACALRLVCREFLAAVTEQPWEDRETVIKGSIAAWRACFHRARSANVQRVPSWGPERRIAPVTNADFNFFVGVRQLSIAGRWGFSAEAFVELGGLGTLNMCFCSLEDVAAAEGLKQSGTVVLVRGE